MKKLLLATTLFLSLSFLGSTDEVNANTTHTVKSGDTLWKLGVQYGVPVNSIKSTNNKSTNLLLVGERLQIPSSLTSNEKDLLARLVRAEAEGEPYAGKVAVATVVLNRVDSSLFPNSLWGVINEVSGGYYAFSPVQNGRINRASDADSRRAVEEALAFRGQGSGSLYFYNPAKTSNQWIRTRPVTVTIGNHVFAR
ncbi:cell wall hydrolase [Bacillus sp. FJAT-45350]|uniref:cell wall hydrolase n=1 Tax=Bacillus sp. FJAT-45350 TaxID=2011014 RepID=UPI000BB71944|nr:cell wall hydrolase [Bacillus sp. FJAT-45350]